MRWLAEPLELRSLLATLPAGFVDETWGGAIANGTAMAFAPDGRLFVLTQFGTVRVIDTAGDLLPEPALTLDVAPGFERGLLGIAFDPVFASNRHVYLHYATPSPGSVSQISRFNVNGDTIDAASRTDIFQLGLSAGGHQGGGIHFGTDGMLYMGRGDNGDGAAAQRIDSPYGKLLRINPAAYHPADPLAVIPADNPTSFPGVAGTPTGAHRAIWAVGLRNPFTFAVHPNSGRLLINDVGAGSFEEINDGIAGRNYGWPSTEGGFDPAQFPDFTPPLYYYDRSAFGGTTIAGSAFYLSTAPGAFPAQYQGKYFFADFGHGWIGYIDPDVPPATPSTHRFFANGVGAVVDLDIGPDGALYYLRRTGPTAGVYRITSPPSTPPAATINLPSRYNAGDAVHFSASVMDPDQPAFPPSAFLWSIVLHHDGQTEPILGPVSGASGTLHVPRVGVASVDQFYRVHLTVTDDTGLKYSAMRDIHPNTANITLLTHPPDMTIHFDGQPYATPLTVQNVVGYQRTLGAPSNQLHDDQWLEFFMWGDTVERVREIFVPERNTLYLAVYVTDAAAPTVTASRFDHDGVLLPDAPHRLRFAFSEDVSASLAAADLLLVNVTTGQTIPGADLALAWDPVANLATFTYTGSAQRVLPDGNYVATLVGAGVTDPPGHALRENHVLSFRVLAGDADGDGRVNLRDFNALAANFGRANALFSQGNFNYDVAVDADDLAILTSRFGTALPGAAPVISTGVRAGDEDDALADLLA